MAGLIGDIGLSGSQSQAINPISDFLNESDTNFIFGSSGAVGSETSTPENFSPTTTATSTASTALPGTGGSSLTSGSSLTLLVIAAAALLFLSLKHHHP